MKKLLVMLLAVVMMLSCTAAFAWEPQWAYDEDLSAYKLCENFGDIKLRVAVTDLAAIEDWETNAFTLWMEEVTNVDLEFELIPYESRAEKLGLLLNSGSPQSLICKIGIGTPVLQGIWGGCTQSP